MANDCRRGLSHVTAIDHVGSRVSVPTSNACDQKVTARAPDAADVNAPHHPGDRIGLIRDNHTRRQLTA